MKNCWNPARANCWRTSQAQDGQDEQEKLVAELVAKSKVKLTALPNRVIRCGK